MPSTTTDTGDRVGSSCNSCGKSKTALKQGSYAGNPEYFWHFRKINERLERIESILLKISGEVRLTSPTVKRTRYNTFAKKTEEFIGLYISVQIVK